MKQQMYETLFDMMEENLDNHAALKALVTKSRIIRDGGVSSSSVVNELINRKHKPCQVNIQKVYSLQGSQVQESPFL